MKYYLVTGGAGFIGSRYIQMLFDEMGDDVFVINVDKLTYAANLSRTAAFSERENYEFVYGDIRDERNMEVLFEQYPVDVVVNFAAESHVDRSIAAAGDFMNTNVLGTHVLLDCAKRLAPKARFVQISTDEVYGAVKKRPFRESDRLLPSNPYAASKASGDLLALSFFRTFGMDVIVTRSANNFGESQHEEKLLPKLTKCAFLRCEMPIYGSGAETRDWIAVEDNCRAIRLAEQYGRSGQIYNISDDHPLSNLESARRIARIVGKQTGEQGLARLIKFVPDRLGHDFRYALDTSKIQNLGYKPTTEAQFEKRFKQAILGLLERFRTEESLPKVKMPSKEDIFDLLVEERYERIRKEIEENK